MVTKEALLQTNLLTMGDNVTSDTTVQLDQSYADDAMWILSCTFVIFTMQSGKLKERERERGGGERE